MILSVPAKTHIKKITILITDDHTLLRETWNYIFNSDPRFNVVATSGNGEDAIELAKKLCPDIVIMDINLPGISGIEATKLICKYSTGTKVLGVSLHNQPAYARKMIQVGAMGYITKNSSRDEMFHAILELQSGRKYISEEIKNILSEQVMNGVDQSGGLGDLSKRELQIIEGVKTGSSSKEIAEALNISVKTVEVHRYNILKKLKLKNAAALVNF
ncbi:MAG TPA: response regulator transcription factor, partial [Flavisolibacter sp.]|nr:response regulator transcription factor [Flavisolibacter sp.]